MTRTDWRQKSEKIQKFISDMWQLTLLAIFVFLYDVLKRIRERDTATDAIEEGTEDGI